ncbi:MAG TPA: NAD+ synthase [Oceanospirillales bacterium]|nr:NAD+ synthase [Oceanospirillales bacterium]
MQQVSIALAQVNFKVGDIDGNVQLIANAVADAKTQHGQSDTALMVVFSELALIGYPPEDLLLRPSLQHRIESALQQVANLSSDVAIVVGYPWHKDGQLFNMAGVWSDGKQIAQYAKRCLPNYQVFDEQRYFAAGDEVCVFDWQGHKIGLTVCEDIWHGHPVEESKAAGAEFMVNINASPFHAGKLQQRHKLLGDHAKAHQLPIVYVNQVGAQDELVFDGGSFVVDANGSLVATLAEHESLVKLVDFDENLAIKSSKVALEKTELASIYDTLVVGVRDYIEKNGFKGIVLGLSGGIDSALTLAIAVDAIGKDRVEAVMMPFKYTSSMSMEDAKLEADALGVSYKILPIEPMYDSFMHALEDEFAGLARDTTEENLQARCRGVMLMAISNKKGYMVLTTGNKSEMAVGYATLYGDMVGGYSALKDVYKTIVFQLSRYRNEVAAEQGENEIIPDRVITRPPSAELAPDQVDEDSLPPYDILDQILEYYIEGDLSVDAIIAKGFDREEVTRVTRLVDLSEYKRRQAPVGVRITSRGFGRDRRYPITNGWKAGG